ncbi:MAG: glycosyltransferase [Candidatus Micrarchaeia archaeon]
MYLWPQVTLGICTKNNEKTILKTLESILRSNYPVEKMELIIVDGISQDNTVNIVKRILATSSISWKLLSDNGRGLAYARQLVVENANGKYIIWVDGDHILPPSFIKNHIIFMELNPTVGAAEGITKHKGKNLVSILEGYTWYLYSLKRVNKNLESVGSAGTIYRVEAIREVGGYDINIKGAGEDGDISRRIRKKGWKLFMNKNAIYYHQTRTTWKSLWKEYYWWGYGAHYVYHKHQGSVNPLRFIPIIAFFSGIKHGIQAFRLTKDIRCIFMPIHYCWKRIAWIIGFLKAHKNNYGHFLNK